MKKLVPNFANALPFWMSLLFVPLIALAATQGGWTILLVPAYGYVVMTLLDGLSGLEVGNMDPETEESKLGWYKLITLIWLPVQLAIIFGTLMVVSWSDHLSMAEKVFLMMAVGVVSGSIGINYAHELIHQKNRLEQWLGDLLLMSVAYGHFRSEHVLVHHRYVGTPRDTVTARYDENFYHFFARVVPQQFVSAWRAECELLQRRGWPAWHPRNPFWRYGAGVLAFAGIGWMIGGVAGIGFWVLQSLFAILQLEMVNYVEHYGLTRKYLGENKYEHVKPRHSWNAAQRMTNFLLINLQRHSDHHYKPDRRFPLLQNYDQADAPQLPFGYPLMTAMALFPPLWRRVMNRRVGIWRMKYYPEVEDWTPYNMALNPLPR